TGPSRAGGTTGSRAPPNRRPARRPGRAGPGRGTIGSSVGEVPEFHGPVPAPGGEQRPVRGEREAEHLAGVREPAALLPGGRVPQPDVAGPVPVAVAAGERLAVGAERDGPHVAGVALERGDLRP